MKVKRDEGVMINETCFSLLVYVNDIVLLGEGKCIVVDLYVTLIESAKKGWTKY